MTQAYNLSQLANGVNTSGQLNIASYTTGTLPSANLPTVPVDKGGTGQTTYTNGQLLIGNTTGNTLTKATLTAGTNITITNGNGSITIDAAGGSPTTAQVLSATAGANAGDVGTYAFLGRSDSAAIATMVFGTNYAGSLFVPGGFVLSGNTGWNAGGTAAANGGFGGSALSGTWKAMGQFNNSTNGRVGSVMLRVA